MKLQAFIVCALLSCSPICKLCASDVPVHGVTIGLQSGDIGKSLEAMYSYGSLVYWPKTSMIKGLGAISVGMETGPLNADRFIIAPKISYTMNWFVSFGASMLYYTDFHGGSLRFRPEIGISMLGVRVYHGWNFSVDRYNPLPMNTSFLGLTYFVKF
ncbi:MAG: hypothetical protein FJ212_04050 [Ignavibacteria bacterium]|jgi:hypothetical protein|nr:hypothetical protein [Ignavibacteria bacterium]